MSLKARDVDRVYSKFQMEIRDGKDRYALLYYGKKLILRSKRSLGKLQKEDLGKITVKELMVIVAVHFNDQFRIISERMKSIENIGKEMKGIANIGKEMKAIKKVGWVLILSIFIGIIVYIATQLIPLVGN